MVITWLQLTQFLKVKVMWQQGRRLLVMVSSKCSTELEFEAAAHATIRINVISWKNRPGIHILQFRRTPKINKNALSQ